MTASEVWVSTCLFCHYKIPLLNTPIGKPGDPVGLCGSCNSLTCGWHGTRTSSPAFLCLLCDINALSASADWGAFKRMGGLSRLPQGRGAGTDGVRSASDEDFEAAADLAQALAALFSVDGEPSFLVVATLRQWVAERPSHKRFGSVLGETTGWAVEILNRFFLARRHTWTTQYVFGTYDERAVHAMWNTLGEDSRWLLAAAALLVVTLDLPWEALPAPVVAVTQLLGGLLRDYPERLGTLHERITGTTQR